jgi:transcriptional regulator
MTARIGGEIDKEKVLKLLKQGLVGSVVARRLNCSYARVSQIKKEIRPCESRSKTRKEE